MIRLTVKYKLRAIRLHKQEYFEFDNSVHEANPDNFLLQAGNDFYRRLGRRCRYKIISVVDNSENLNILENTTALVLKALNNYPTFQAAAAVLGIGTRSLWVYRKQNRIICIDNIWQEVPKKIIKI